MHKTLSEQNFLGNRQLGFVEGKLPDFARVEQLLRLCYDENMWANRGPLYTRLTEAYAEHLGAGPDVHVIPCANGGVALEAMARIHEATAGAKLRWVGSAFSFRNLGRGYFADMGFVDCDDAGLIDVAALRALDPSSFDGVVAVNPCGMLSGMEEVIAFAKETGKALILDNAAGVHTRIPDWPWQAFSLHHTKPYGVGEGGLALTPKACAEPLYELLSYGMTAPENAALWLNNGKISDVGCAFQLDRLERAADWRAAYFEQRERVARIAAAAGLRPLIPLGDNPPTTSMPFLAETPLPLPALARTRRLTFGKYYQPLAETPKATRIFDHVLCVPTHPDLACLRDDEIREDIDRVLGQAL